MSPESFSVAASGPQLRLRLAQTDDTPLLERWNREPHLIVRITDDPDADTAFEDVDWAEDIRSSNATSFYLIGEIPADGGWRSIGAMQIADPHLEPSHYWGEIAPNLRAVDIWIGDPQALNQGHGSRMLRQAVAACFSDPGVEAIVIDPLASNADAHRFYQRLGFVPEERRLFGDEDDCLIHRLTRNDWEAQS